MSKTLDLEMVEFMNFFSSWIKIIDSRLVELSERSVKRGFDHKIKIQIMLSFYALVADIKP